MDVHPKQNERVIGLNHLQSQMDEYDVVFLVLNFEQSTIDLGTLC